MAATIFTLSSPSPSPSPSTFLSSSTLKHFSSFTAKQTLPIHFTKRPISLSATSLHSPATGDLPPEVQTFWQWLQDQGVVSAKSPIRPGMVPEGLGLITKNDITRNEVVFEIPNRFWINQDAVAASEIGSVVDNIQK
ncbi:hypothetical protein CRYUN_Cryun29cG0096800 [Craigia yunnanensis]